MLFRSSPTRSRAASAFRSVSSPPSSARRSCSGCCIALGPGTHCEPHRRSQPRLGERRNSRCARDAGGSELRAARCPRRSRGTRWHDDPRRDRPEDRRGGARGDRRRKRRWEDVAAPRAEWHAAAGGGGDHPLRRTDRQADAHHDRAVDCGRRCRPRAAVRHARR